MRQKMKLRRPLEVPDSMRLDVLVSRPAVVKAKRILNQHGTSISEYVRSSLRMLTENPPAALDIMEDYNDDTETEP